MNQIASNKRGPLYITRSCYSGCRAISDCIARGNGRSRSRGGRLGYRAYWQTHTRTCKDGCGHEHIVQVIGGI